MRPSSVKIGRKETALALLAGFALIFSVSYFTGALTSGYHFTEDYEYFEILDNLAAGKNILKTVVQYTLEDYKRMRIYYLNRVLETAAFGTNVTAMRIQLGCMGALAMFFLYVFARKIKFKPWEALLFSALAISGQMTIWWRMGTAENLGFFFMAMSLALDGLPFAVSMALMSLAKESFIVIVPSVVFLKVWLNAAANNISLVRSAKQNIATSIIPLIFAGLQLFWILKITGAVIAGYVGYEGFNPGRFLKIAQDLALAGNAWLPAVSALTVIFSLIFKKDRAGLLRELACLLVFFFLMTVPLLLLFQKSGIGGHYSLPGIFAFYFAFFYGHRLSKPALPSPLRLLMALTVIAVIFFNVRGNIQSAREFAAEGQMVKTLVKTIEKNTSPEDMILVVAEPARNLEWSYAVSRYLERLAGRKNLYLFPIIRLNYSEFEKYLAYGSPKSPLKLYSGRTIRNVGDREKIRAVVTLPFTEAWFVLSSRGWFQKNLYERVKDRDISIYYRK